MEHILRSMIFVPGFRKDFLENAKSFEADALIFDLEDSVPELFKEIARINIADYLGSTTYKQKIFVRLNSIDSGYIIRDLEAVITSRLFGFVPAMIRDQDDLKYLDNLLTQMERERGFQIGQFKLLPLIEVGSAVLKAYEIARCSERVVGLAFGAEDYLTDLGGLHKETGASILTARSIIVMAARTLKLAAIDTPFLDVYNLEAFKNEVEFARELGFSGQLILHPCQIKTANQIFMPSDAEVSEARRVINAIEASAAEGSGVALLNGRLVGPPMEKRARKILRLWEKIQELQCQN